VNVIAGTFLGGIGFGAFNFIADPSAVPALSPGLAFPV
jgi:hypothetical protein